MGWWSDKAAGGGVSGPSARTPGQLCTGRSARTSRSDGLTLDHFAERPDSSGGGAKAVTSDDEAILILHFDGGGVTKGATGLVSMSVVEMGRSEHALEVFGSEGALRVAGADGLWHSRVGEGEWRKIETESAPLAFGMRDNEWSRGFTAFAREIVGALREGRTSSRGGHLRRRPPNATRARRGAASHESGCRVTIKD